MKKIKDLIQDLKDFNVFWSWVIALVSVGLVIASFIIPPTGVIDATVFAAIGELGGLKVILFDLADMIKAGVKIHYKNLTINEEGC